MIILCWNQPPPSLPRWGGTDTIDCMIIVCSYLIINRLSTAIVTVPPLRGRLGGGWSQYAEPLLFPHGSELRIENSFPAQPVYLGLSLVCFCEVVTAVATDSCHAGWLSRACSRKGDLCDRNQAVRLAKAYRGLSRFLSKIICQE